MLVLSALVGLGLCTAILVLANKADYAYSNTVPSVAALGQTSTDIGNLSGRIGLHILADTPEKTQAVDTVLTSDLQKIEREIAGYKSLLTDEREQALYQTTVENWQALVATLPALRAESLAVRTASATALFNQRYQPAAEKVSASIAQLVDYNTALNKASAEHTSLLRSIAIGGGVAATAILIFAAAALGSMSRRRVVRPLVDLVGSVKSISEGRLEIDVAGIELTNEIGDLARVVDASRIASIARNQEQAVLAEVVQALTAALEKLAAGNLAFRIEQPFDGRYEALRESFNQAIASLGESLALVASAAAQVDKGATEILSAAQDLANRNESQAASLEETNGAMQSVAKSVDVSAGEAKTMLATISAVSTSARDGEAVIGEAITAMDQIEESSKMISQIVSLIDGIAFQTNLLALNAGVEAARAGESGKGFAVVANEVRALAQRAADASKEIGMLITQSTQQVTTGVELVVRSGDRLQDISGALGTSIDLVTKIAAASERQTMSVNEVSRAVMDMDRLTQQNAAMAEQSNAAARSLSTSARDLSNLVARFELPKSVGPASEASYRKAA